RVTATLGRLYRCFFFSSRRRHTRLVSDWSSDVCSSDLLSQYPTLRAKHVEQRRILGELAAEIDDAAVGHRAVAGAAIRFEACKRSEERRVGKEGGSGRVRDAGEKEEVQSSERTGVGGGA